VSRASGSKTLVHKSTVSNQTGALMRPQGAGTDQTSICPSQGLFESYSITLTPKMHCPSFRWSQSTIKTDGQDQANL
jgi:hypothetical protein